MYLNFRSGKVKKAYLELWNGTMMSYHLFWIIYQDPSKIPKCLDSIVTTLDSKISCDPSNLGEKPVPMVTDIWLKDILSESINMISSDMNGSGKNTEIKLLTFCPKWKENTLVSPKDCIMILPKIWLLGNKSMNVLDWVSNMIVDYFVLQGKWWRSDIIVLSNNFTHRHTSTCKGWSLDVIN